MCSHFLWNSSDLSEKISEEHTHRMSAFLAAILSSTETWPEKFHLTSAFFNQAICNLSFKMHLFYSKSQREFFTHCFPPQMATRLRDEFSQSQESGASLALLLGCQEPKHFPWVISREKLWLQLKQYILKHRDSRDWRRKEEERQEALYLQNCNTENKI